MKLPLQRRSTSHMLAALVLGLSCVYLVPFHVPVRDGLSFSFLFGFSNRTAVLLLLGFILGFASWTGGLGLDLPSPLHAYGDSSSRAGSIAVVCSVLGAFAVWIWAWALTPFAEAQYFLDRAEMFRMGGRLFVDFEFDYGPLMFYPIVMLSHITGLSLGNSYYLLLILQWGLGTWTLWRVVVIASRGTPHGRMIFLLLWTFFLTALADSGLNYTPLRFCGTLAIALWVHHLYTRGSPNPVTFGFACLGSVVMLFYSPEQGIALTVGTVLFFLICVRPVTTRVLAGLAGFVGAMSLAFWLGLRSGLLNNVRTVGAGTLNFPVLFSFQTLVLLLLVTVAGCVVIANFRERTANHPLLYLICISAVTLPAAFSRADVGHIVLNTLGALIAALVVLSQYPALWRWAWPGFAMVIILSSYAHLQSYKDTVRNQIHTAVFDSRFHSRGVETIYMEVYKLTHRNAQDELAKLRGSLASTMDANAPSLPSHTYLFAPYGVQRRIQIPAEDPQIVTGFYPWLLPITSAAEIPRKIAEMESHPDWPIVIGWAKPTGCSGETEDPRKYLRRVLFVLYVPPARRRVDPARPFCEYLETHYRPGPYASPVPGAFVWLPKSPEGERVAGPNH